MTDAPLVEGRDYVIDAAGRYVLSAAYLSSRGRCCGSGCQNCPYGKPSAVEIEKPATTD